jgi:hypothetical protein
MPSISALLDRLDPAVTFDLALDSEGVPTREPEDLARAVSTVPARYAPECVSRCEMAFHCRDEARAQGSTDVLGRTVRDALGGVGTVTEVLALASAAPSDDAVLHAVLAPGSGLDDALVDPEAARLLRTARRARAEALMSAADRESA